MYIFIQPNFTEYTILENKINRVKNIGRTKFTIGLLCGGKKTGHFKCQLTSKKIIIQI